MGMTWKAMPAEAAKIPVIKNGSAVSLKGTIINVRYSGEEVSLASSAQKAPSVKIGSTIYVPCRTLFSENGIRASYSANGSKVTLRYGARKVIFYANKKYAKVNGTKMKLKVSPYFVTFRSSGINDLLVPVNQAASFFGLKYSYSNSARTVTLQVRPGISQRPPRQKMFPNRLLSIRLDRLPEKIIKEPGFLLRLLWHRQFWRAAGDSPLWLKTEITCLA